MSMPLQQPESESTGQVVPAAGDGQMIAGPWAGSATSPAERQAVEPASTGMPAARVAQAQARVAAPYSAKPLSVEQAGGRYQYLASLAKDGAKRVPQGLVDAVLNRVRLAHLREGGHHRGEILPAQRNVYEAEVRERRERRRRFAKAIFVRKVTTVRHRKGVASTRDTYRPRWLTVGPIAAETVNVAYPDLPVVSPLVNAANGHVGDFVGSLFTNIGEALVGFTYSVPGALAIVGGAAGLVAWQARREHHDRQSRLIAIMASSGDADLMPDEPSDALTAAFRDAGILKAATGAAPGQRVDLLAPISDDGDRWVAHLQLPRGMAYERVTKRRAQLASALDAEVSRVGLAPVPGAERQLKLTVHRVLPFTGDPVPHPLVTNPDQRISFFRDGFPVGLDINGEQVRIRLSRKSSPHGLIVGASGMGKTVHLLNLVLSAFGSEDAEVGGIFDGKASGDYAPVRDGIDWYVDDQESSEWWEILADRLEEEVQRLPERQARIKAGEHVRMRILILDEFQRGFGKPSERTSSRRDDEPPSPAYRVVTAAEELSRLGRAAGVALVLASQSFDGNVLPSAIEANLLWRIVGYVGSSSVSPKASLGEAADLYGLEPEKEFTRSQQGAAIVIAPGIDTYATARGWYQDDATLAETVRALTSQHQKRDGEATSPQVADVIPFPVAELVEDEPEVDIPEVSERARRILMRAAEVYAADDSEVIGVSALHEEITKGELGWEPTDRLRREVAEALEALGVRVVRSRALGESRPKAWPREELVAAGQRLMGAA